MEKFMDIHDNSCSKPSAKRYNFIFMFIPVLFDKLQFFPLITPPLHYHYMIEKESLLPLTINSLGYFLRVTPQGFKPWTFRTGI